MTFKEHIAIARRAWKTAYEWDKGYFLSQLGASLLSAATPFVPIYFSARVVDALFDGAEAGRAALYAALAVGITFLLKLLEAALNAVKSAASTKAFQREGWSFAEKAMEMDILTAEDPETARLRERIRMESQIGFNRFYLFHCAAMIVSSLTRILSAAALSASFFAMDAVPLWARLGLLLGVVLTVALSAYAKRRETEINNKFHRESVGANTYYFSFFNYVKDLTGAKDIRLYAMRGFLEKRGFSEFRVFFESIKRASDKAMIWTLPVSAAGGLLRIGLYSALLFAAFAGGITVGSIARYAASVLLLLSGARDLVSALEREWMNHEYLARYFSWFDLPNRMKKGTLTVEKRDDCDYEIEFRHVSFRYPGAEEDALKDVSLTFKIGEKLALVGENGSGKTTFIKLLTRLYDPREGEILLNGVDIRKYDYGEYLGIFSVVFQDFRLFPFPLGEVVAAGREYDEERVTESLRKANFGERLKDFPGGLRGYLYKTFDESGVEISGGEAQKIALARALYKNAPFILLDEPTAALDPESEYEVYSNFNAIAGDKTTVYISHRLASCRFCDKIAVFDGGRIAEVGDHRSLLEKGGKYEALWNAQAQYYRENGGEA